MQETQEIHIQSPGWEDPLEEVMATDSSILAWRIPRTEEPGGLESMGSQRVEHEWACSTALSISSYLESPASCMCNFQAWTLFWCLWLQRLSGLPVQDWHPCWVGWWPNSGDPPHRAAPEPGLEALWWSPVSGALADASSGQMCSETIKVTRVRPQSQLLSVFPFKAWGIYILSSKVSHKEWPNQNLSILPQKYPWLITVVLIERGVVA